MFESLGDRRQGVIKRVRGKGRLTAEDVDEILAEIRTALLEADGRWRDIADHRDLARKPRFTTATRAMDTR